MNLNPDDKLARHQLYNIATMKCTIITTVLAATTLTSLADWPLFEGLTLGASGRARLEARDAQGADSSTAGTFSLSPSLKTSEWGGFSAFLETEHTLAFFKDYSAGTGQAAILNPYAANNTPIGDPETNELNQAYLQYKGSGFTVKAGRQRIILDKAAFIGNVGWRQNEQTYDGLTVAYADGPYKFTLGWIDQVNRIFGSDARNQVQELEGNGFLFNGSFKGDGYSVGAYSYLLDFSDEGAASGDFASSKTFGGYFTSNGIYGEATYQTEGGDQADYEAFYGHLKYTQKFAGLVGTVGLEYIGEDFITPLATVHAYNGFADAFIGQRLGLGNPAPGLANFYASVVKKGLPGGLVFKGFLHYFMDQGFDETYGWEADMVLAKKLSKSTKLVTKFAYFFADNDTAYTNDIAQASVQLDFKF